MYQDYIMDIDESSIWLIAHLEAICRQVPFQIHEAGHFLAGPQYYTVREGKEDYLLIYTCSGRGNLEYEDFNYDLRKGSIALIDCRKYHSYRTHPFLATKDWNIYWMHFSGSSSAYYYKALFGAGFQIIYNDDDYLLTSQFEKLLQDFDKPGLTTCFRLSDYVSHILLGLIELRLSSEQKNHSHQKLLETATDFIRENYHSKITIEDMASSVSISKYYFIKLFKQHMCVTPYEFLISCRMVEAKKLLRGSNLSVTKISEMVGFNDECHFIRMFKKHTGWTPLNYRKNY